MRTEKPHLGWFLAILFFGLLVALFLVPILLGFPFWSVFDKSLPDWDENKIFTLILAAMGVSVTALSFIAAIIGLLAAWFISSHFERAVKEITRKEFSENELKVIEAKVWANLGFTFGRLTWDEKKEVRSNLDFSELAVEYTLPAVAALENARGQEAAAKQALSNLAEYLSNQNSEDCRSLALQVGKKLETHLENELEVLPSIGFAWVQIGFGDSDGKKRALGYLNHWQRQNLEEADRKQLNIVRKKLESSLATKQEGD